MKQYIKGLFAIAGFVACAGMTSFAQETYSGYFVENYLYRYQMNPAFGNESNFVGFPGLGNLNAGVGGNLHLTSILYNVDGRTSLFTNPNVPAAEVLRNIHDKNSLGADLKINILNGGFKAWGGYNTISINARANVNTHIPGTLFSLLKEGVENQTYNISDVRARAQAYGEIALNHSRDIKAFPGLRVGATVKFLLGYGNVDARLNNAQLILGEDNWIVESNARINSSVKGLKYKLDFDENANRHYVSGAEINNTGLNGYGLAVDLGLEYKWSDFKFSAAVLDVGFISWNSTQLASTNGTKHFELDNYIFDTKGDDDDTTWDDLKSDLAALYQLEDMGNVGRRTTGLAATLNFGFEYVLPVYRNLSFGLMNSTRILGSYSWTQFRLGATIRPVKCLSANANFEFGTYGIGFGWLLNLNTNKGFSLFLGMDQTPWKLAKQGVPLNSNARVNFGMNFPF